MQIITVLAHPEISSFNKAIFDVCNNKLKENAYEVLAIDLYRDGFDPLLLTGKTSVPDNSPVIERLCNELIKSNGMVIVHPNWWGQPPAILKGFVDKVFRSGIAYKFNKGDNGEGVPKGLLNYKAALVFNTSDTLSQREKEVFGDPLELIWKKCIFEFSGVTNFYRQTFGIIANSTKMQRENWLLEVSDKINTYFPPV
jgi:putative NADPH-quinone reductase